MKNALPYIAVITAMLIWSVSGIAVKEALTVLPPLTLIVMRFSIAVVLMLCIGLTARAVSRITVNAAKPAVPVYEALGFEAYGEETTKDGITSLPMEYLINQEMLGRTVTVTVDRPYGSLHPHYPDTEYPCNYGYVEEVLAGDGEFQDAYIIGVYEPVEQFTGVVTAIIYRRNDSESKWVVTKDGTCSKQEVIDAVGELEQYFDTRIIWLEDHVIN